jgi:hypothetical protein
MAVGMKRARGWSRGWSKAFLGAALALTLSAAACSSDKSEAPGVGGKRASGKDQNVGPCPLMGVLYEASRLVELRGPEERFANVGYTGEIRGVTGLCRYVGADPITMDINIAMAFGRGPKADSDTHTYRYWVAVARRDIAPLTKQYFNVEVKFPSGADRTGVVEQIEKIVIPRANKDTSGVNFEIVVGFDLTPAQIAFNREGKRFRVNPAASSQ